MDTPNSHPDSLDKGMFVPLTPLFCPVLQALDLRDGAREMQTQEMPSPLLGCLSLIPAQNCAAG